VCSRYASEVKHHILPTLLPRTEEQRAFRQRQRLERIFDLYLRHCYRQRTPVRSTELAGFMHIHPSTLSRVVKRYLGVTPHEALRDRQISEASRLLRDSNLAVDNIGRRVGFGTRATFFRVFAKATGMSPGEYRKVKK
jgi:AraC family transcriptional regulator